MSDFPITATYQPISEEKINPIEVISNRISPNIDQSSRKNPKYKKVGKQGRQELLRLVEKGYSIISAAGKLEINYSTAKSIIQKHKKNLERKKQNNATASDQNIDSFEESDPQMKQEE